jgi:hypothetical protein
MWPFSSPLVNSGDVATSPFVVVFSKKLRASLKDGKNFGPTAREKDSLASGESFRRAMTIELFAFQITWKLWVLAGVSGLCAGIVTMFVTWSIQRYGGLIGGVIAYVILEWAPRNFSRQRFRDFFFFLIFYCRSELCRRRLCRPLLD